MNMCKKIISILLCLCILSGFVTVASASTTVKMDKYEIVDILKTLGMLSSDYDAVTIDWQKPMTRAEFAYHAANVLKRDHAKSEKLYFYDVSKQHWASPSISTLVECELLEVGQDKKFNPNDNITREDVTKIMLKALGYRFDFNANEYIDMNGIANSIGITNNISNVEQLTFADVLFMLYNTLNAEVLEISGISNNAGMYKSSGKTYLEKEYSISFRKGVVEGFDGAAFTDAGIDKGVALISGVEYEAEKVDLRDMLGCNVYYLYSFDDEEDAGEILWVKKDKTEEITLYYDENRISFDSSSYELTYYEGDSSRRKKIDIARAADVIYNDEYVEFGIEELLAEDAYSIKLIKNSGEKEYSKIILSDYENIIVGAIDNVGYGIYDKSTKQYLELKNVDNLAIIKDGRNVELSDLALGDVLSIYTSKTGNSVRIVASNTVVRGTLAAKYIEKEYQYVTIGDVEYRWYEKEDRTNLSLKSPITLYLDANGHIAYAEQYIAEGNLGFMIDIKMGDNEEFITVEMYKLDGKFEKINTIDELRIDGKKYKYIDAAFGAMGGKEFRSSLVLYKTNVDGLITHISFPSAEENAELKLLQNNVSATYRDSGRLGRKSFINDKTIIFAIPKNPKNAPYDEFERISKSGLSGDTSYVYSTYSLSEEVAYEEIMVIHNFEHKSEIAGLLVTDVYMGLNEDEDPVYFLDGYTGTSFVTLKCDPACSARSIVKECM